MVAKGKLLFTCNLILMYILVAVYNFCKGVMAGMGKVAKQVCRIDRSSL